MAIDNTRSVTDRIAAAETRVFKAVFPSTTNQYDTLFGGTALQLMDEVAFMNWIANKKQRLKKAGARFYSTFASDENRAGLYSPYRNATASSQPVGDHCVLSCQ